MLMLLFRVEGERWAIAASEIRAVIPLVDLQKMPHSHPTIAGLLNYHGEMLPVVDVAAAIAHQPTSPAMSTRIAITQALSKDLATEHASQPQPQVALIIDQAGEMARLTEAPDWVAKSDYVQAAYSTSAGERVHRLALASFFELNRVR